MLLCYKLLVDTHVWRCMMYNHLLDTFLAVCDCKSFTKAAKQLYISPTAVMKQINQLEKELDLKLIERTHAGARQRLDRIAAHAADAEHGHPGA